jgi:hypothetical protein
MRLKKTSFFLVFILLLEAAGCATYKQTKINVRPVSEYPSVRTAEGISVALDPYDSAEEAKQGFQRDVTREGFVPVNLIVRNDTDENVRINRHKIELIDENGVIYRPVSSKAMFEEFKIDAFKRLAALSIISVWIGALSYISAKRANRKMEADWQRKEIPDHLIIPPKSKIHGFVYFKLPEGQTTVSQLRLESERMSTRKKVQIEITPTDSQSLITISPIQEENPTETSLTGPNV